jgi:hypothetical protein
MDRTCQKMPSDLPPTRRGSGLWRNVRWSGVWLTCWLTAAVVAGWQSFASVDRAPPPANTSVAPRPQAIETIAVGQNVLSNNPLDQLDSKYGVKVDPPNWRKLVLRAPKTDGSFAEVVLLRPLWWLEVQAARVGGTVEISAADCGIDGEALVRGIEPCPPVEPPLPGYQTVTGTYKHLGVQVIDVYVDGLKESIGVTPNHPFWSEDDREFVRADELAVGERLRSVDGYPQVVAIVPRDSSEPVFNLEVQLTHTYYVTSDGILVHNVTPWGKEGLKFCVWFNKQSAEAIAELMKNKETRNQIKSALRGKGGMHEWMMVSQAALSRKWGMTAEDIMTAVSGTKDLDKKLRALTNGQYGHSGKAGSALHEKLRELMESSDSADEYKDKVKAFFSSIGLKDDDIRSILPDWFFN